MNLITIFNTQTTGLPDWAKPSGEERQPHIVQLAALQVDLDTKKVIQSIDLIVKPYGWEITQEMTDIHGITNEHALDVGIDEKRVVEIFLSLVMAYKRVAFGTAFHNRIIRIATKRYFDKAVQDYWKDGDYECAMMKAKKLMDVRSVNLIDAYSNFTGKQLKSSLSNMDKVKACMELYFEIKDKEPVTA